KQEEEGGAEQAEQLRLHLQLGHDRHGSQADHDLVGEIHHHEEKQQKRDSPGAFGSRLHGHFLPPSRNVLQPCYPGISLNLRMAFPTRQPAIMRGRDIWCHCTAEGYRLTLPRALCSWITFASVAPGCRDLVRCPCYAAKKPRELP